MNERIRPFEREQISVILGDDSQYHEIYLSENGKQKLLFQNEHCAFVPVGFLWTDFGWMPLAYKVVTSDLMSLGLRRNPSRMFFPTDEWVFEDKTLQYNNRDDGGIWTAHRLGNARTLTKYCAEKGMETKIFLTAIYNPVAFVGNYRIKSEGVRLIREIEQ